MKLSDYIEFNPRVILAKTEPLPFVSMDAVNPGRRWVLPQQQRLATGSGSKFAPGDTLFARITPCLENGKIAQYAGEQPGLGSTEFFVLRARSGISDPAFVFYFAQNRELRSAAEKSMSGTSGRQRAEISALSEFQCVFPPLPDQRQIAGILSAYDGLIENNTRRIKILEEMVQSIYREWFVHFRFPGHEKVKLVDSPMGKIPEGWAVKKLADMCEIVMGQSPKSEFYNERGEGLPFHQGVTDFGDRFPEDRVYCVVDNRIAEKGDILFSVRAPVGRINVANKKVVLGRGLSAIRSKTGRQRFAFQQLKEKFQVEDTMGGGTIFKAVTKDDVQRIEMLVPPESLIDGFEEFVRPIFSNLEVLTTKNGNLRRTRNLLLPRLISGGLDVENASTNIGG